MSASPASLTDKSRSFGLDVARAVAIGLVFASHTVVDVVGPVGVTVVQWGGRAGVELFFGLSGFLIGSILIKTARRRLDPGAVGGFLFRRWMRTLPLYYAVLWAAGWFFGVQNVHAYLLLQNFFPAEPRVLAASWSLVLEEYFYLFFPLTMLLLTAVLGQGTRVVAATAAGLIAVCVTGRVLNAAGVFQVDLNVMHESPFMRMDCAAYGVVAALLMREGGRLRHWLTIRRARALLGACLVLTALWCALFVLVVHVPGEQLLRFGFGTWGHSYIVMQWSPLGPLFAATVLCLWAMQLRPPPLLGPALRCISLWSYSIYLLHTVVIALVDYYHLGGTGWVRIATITAISLGASALTYALIELPVLRLRDLMVRGPEPLDRRSEAQLRQDIHAT